MTVFFTVGAILCALYLILLLLISPSDRIHPEIGLLKGARIAHRGLHNASSGIPENSLISFEKAIEKGFPIEIDLHLTRDGRVVVFHDDDTERMCGVAGKIAKMDLKEIQGLRLLDTKEKIPTLEECLERVAGKVFLLIEFKIDDGNTKALCSAADKILSSYDGKYFVQSFYPQVLRWYKKNRKKVCRGQLAQRFVGQGVAKFLLGQMFLNFLGKPDFIAYRHQDGSTLMRRFAVWLGAQSVGWTFRSQEELDRNGKYFNTFIFENFIPEEEK